VVKNIHLRKSAFIRGSKLVFIRVNSWFQTFLL